MGSKRVNYGIEMDYIFSQLMAYIKHKDDKTLPVEFRREQHRMIRKGLLSLIRIKGEK